MSWSGPLSMLPRGESTRDLSVIKGLCSESPDRQPLTLMHTSPVPTQKRSHPVCNDSYRGRCRRQLDRRAQVYATPQRLLQVQIALLKYCHQAHRTLSLPSRGPVLVARFACSLVHRSPPPPPPSLSIHSLSYTRHHCHVFDACR
jgi:hypothetical protein